jgi:hypothetical protein
VVGLKLPGQNKTGRNLPTHSKITHERYSITFKRLRETHQRSSITLKRSRETHQRYRVTLKRSRETHERSAKRLCITKKHAGITA